MGRGFAVLALFLLCIASVAATESEDLAVLAANMQQLAKGDYSLECGKAKVDDSVLNTPADINGPSYCIMKTDGSIIFGTFAEAEGIGDISELAGSIIETYAQFNPHVTAGDLPELETLCSTADSETFTACSPVETQYNTIYLYAYDSIHGDNEVLFLVGSDEEISEFEEPTFFSGIADFFGGLFGADTSSPEFIDNPPAEFSAFHHAYFSMQDEKSIAAVWNGKDATITYTGYVTDFNKTFKPREYSLGTGHKQRMALSLSKDDPEDRAVWHALTDRMQPADIAGTPLGAECGNGRIDGFDEQCERGVPITGSCTGYGMGEGTLKCDYATCKIDISDCKCTDVDRDGYYNITASSADVCKAKADCFDSPQNVKINDQEITLPDGTKLNGSGVHPGAVDWCSNGVSENCTSPQPGNFTGEGPGCKEPPVIPPCNKDNICDEDESNETCTDCSQMATSCPTNWTAVKTQGKYAFSTRKGLHNNSELIIKETDTSNQDCALYGQASTIWMNTTSGVREIYYNSGARNMRIFAKNDGDAWLVFGDVSASGSPAGQGCWACMDSKCATLNLRIPYSTASCNQTAHSAILDARWYTNEDCGDCLAPAADGTCKADPLGCFTANYNGGTGGGGGGHPIQPDAQQ